MHRAQLTVATARTLEMFGKLPPNPTKYVRRHKGKGRQSHTTKQKTATNIIKSLVTYANTATAQERGLQTYHLNVVGAHPLRVRSETHNRQTSQIDIMHKHKMRRIVILGVRPHSLYISFDFFGEASRDCIDNKTRMAKVDVGQQTHIKGLRRRTQEQFDPMLIRAIRIHKERRAIASMIPPSTSRKLFRLLCKTISYWPARVRMRRLICSAICAKGIFGESSGGTNALFTILGHISTKDISKSNRAAKLHEQHKIHKIHSVTAADHSKAACVWTASLDCTDMCVCVCAYCVCVFQLSPLSRPAYQLTSTQSYYQKQSKHKIPQYKIST